MLLLLPELRMKKWAAPISAGSNQQPGRRGGERSLLPSRSREKKKMRAELSLNFSGTQKSICLDHQSRLGFT